MNKYNVLVTACGGDIGYSIYKILKNQEFINQLVCCDISAKNPIAYLSKNFEIVEKATSKGYISSLENLVEKYKLDIIIPVSEPELRFLNENDIRTIAGAKVIMASKMAMDIGFDKFKTTEFLKNNELPYPKTYKIGDVIELEYPYILKDPKGCGSKGICLIENDLDFQYYSSKYKDYIAQEYVEGDEYTCGLYRYNNETRCIIFKRELKGGLTGYGELVKNPKIEELLVSVAEKICLEGAINVQLRMNADNVPIIFEINPRFSSTVLFRDRLGFKDLIWSIKDSLNLDKEHFIPSDNKVVFFKIFDEIIQRKD